MDITNIPARLAALPNLSEFSRASGVPIRTLQRMAWGKANPLAATLVTVATELDAFEKDLKRKAKAAAPKANAIDRTPADA